MRKHTAPRYQGKIASWKDEQGFGFIAPNGGGADIFLHVKSFSSPGRRPQPDDVVTFHLGANERGQPRADNVAFVGSNGARAPAGKSGHGSLIVAGAFLILLALAVAASRVPPFVLWLYLALSIGTSIAYARDKRAAGRGAQRTPEISLHLLALMGGWPGALIARRALRHKSSKQSFRAPLWFTVAANCAALGWLLSEAGVAWLAGLPA